MAGKADTQGNIREAVLRKAQQGGLRLSNAAAQDVLVRGQADG